MFAKLFSDKSTTIRRIIILLFTVGFFIFLYLFNNVDKIQLTNQKGTGYEKALVQEVINDNVQADGSRTGSQKVKVRILTGELKGKVLDATSMSGYLYGADCKKGMKVIVSTSISGNSSVVSVYSYYRSPIIYAFVGLFLLIIWAIGGAKGFKSAVGLIFTFICIIFLFIPMLYKGYSPFLSAVIIAILITIVTLYLIGGFSIKTMASILGTIIGVIVAGGSAAGFGHFAMISGFNVSAVEDLVFVSNNTNLKVGGILFAGILIASLGAVMDVSISVASTINEIYGTNPYLTKKELFSSGINVGRDIMGAMSTTLILAYTGGALNTLILIYAYSMKYNQIINMYSIGIQIMQGISGSIAVILTVPLVSFITSELLTSKSIQNTFRKNMKKIINIALIGLVIVCSFQIGYKRFQYYKDSKSYAKIKKIVPTVDVNVPKNSDTHENSKEEKLKDVNPDYKVWINIPNTDIDYPVVQGSDNEFYLHNNFYKEESVSGAIFIDYRNDINQDKNIVFYGHNMKDNTMFTQINKYKEVEDFNNGIIKILKDNKEYIYEIFSVFVLDGNNDNLKISFTSDEDYTNYIKYLKENSLYNKNAEGNTYSNIITLYTCSYEFDGAKTIVCAGLK